MDYRPKANINVKPLLSLLEKRFDVVMNGGTVEHLKTVQKHYREKREFLLAEHGEAGALAHADYAKAVLISEVARLMILREIQPRPKKKKR